MDKKQVIPKIDQTPELEDKWHTGEMIEKYIYLGKSDMVMLSMMKLVNQWIWNKQ